MLSEAESIPRATQLTFYQDSTKSSWKCPHFFFNFLSICNLSGLNQLRTISSIISHILTYIIYSEIATSMSSMCIFKQGKPSSPNDGWLTSQLSNNVSGLQVSQIKTQRSTVFHGGESRDPIRAEHYFVWIRFVGVLAFYVFDVCRFLT